MGKVTWETDSFTLIYKYYVLNAVLFTENKSKKNIVVTTPFIIEYP